MKLFITASNINFSDILEKLLYFVLPPWYSKPPKIVMNLVHLKKDCTDASVYQQFLMKIWDRYCDYIPVYTDGLWVGLWVSHTIISMRLPDLASIFTAEVWAISKALEQFKDFLTLTFVSPSYEAGTFLLLGW